MRSSSGTLLELITTTEPEPGETEVLPEDTFAGDDSPRQWNTAVIGSVVSVDDNGVPSVDFPDNPRRSPLAARTTVQLSRADVGVAAVLLFEAGDPSRPIVMGKIVPPGCPAETSIPAIAGMSSEAGRLTLAANREIVLSCGESSVTLTRAGKVLIKGAYLLSRSTGVNRIKGGSVQIN